MTERTESKRDDQTQTMTKSSNDPKASGQAPVRRSSTAPAAAHASLSSETGTTHIADTVVAKIAGIATREIPGVHSMGSGFARRVGQIRAMVPGQTEGGGSTQGVAVEVGEKEAAIDLDVVTYYGESITEVSEAVRRNIINRVEGMTGLQVVEVNINVDDIFVEGEESTEEEPRVQ